MKKLLLILLCFPMIGFGQCISGDCENGYGTYTWPSGGKYVGEWKDGKRNGLGKYYASQNDKGNDWIYIGEWKDNDRSGYGVIFNYYGSDTPFPQGLWEYKGEWKGDNRNGIGLYNDYKDNYYLAYYVNDERIKIVWKK